MMRTNPTRMREPSRDREGALQHAPLVLVFVVALLRNSRKTERAAGQFLVPFKVRAAPFALLRNSRKTERGAGQFLIPFAVRAAPFALLRNSRKTERGAGQFLVRLAVRAAPFALPAGRGSACVTHQSNTCEA